MKKACIALLVLLLCAGATFPVFARGAKKEKPQATQNVYVETRHHRQYLGGRSGVRSQDGLKNACERSGRLQSEKTDGDGGPEDPVDDAGGSDSKG